MHQSRKFVFWKLEYKRLDSLSVKQAIVINMLKSNLKQRQKIIDLQDTELANNQAKIFLLNEKLKKTSELGKVRECKFVTKGKYFVSGLILGIIIKSLITSSSGGLPY